MTQKENLPPKDANFCELTLEQRYATPPDLYDIIAKWGRADGLHKKLMEVDGKQAQSMQAATARVRVGRLVHGRCI